MPLCLMVILLSAVKDTAAVTPLSQLPKNELKVKEIPGSNRWREGCTAFFLLAAVNRDFIMRVHYFISLLATFFFFTFLTLTFIMGT